MMKIVDLGMFLKNEFVWVSIDVVILVVDFCFDFWVRMNEFVDLVLMEFFGYLNECLRGVCFLGYFCFLVFLFVD